MADAGRRTAHALDLAHRRPGLLVGALTALGYSCWEHGIQHGKLALLAAASYFTPVLSALMASALLQVLPGWSFWQGVALVTLGSLICWWATRSSRD
jgi:drug/metabolite transporter (DMT)-like permease